jgi:hypothetical protein
MRVLIVLILAVVALIAIAGLGQNFADLGRFGLSNSSTNAARDLFDDVVPYDRVITSVAASTSVQKPSNCTVVIVRLTADAPAEPPSLDRTRPDDLQFGGDWRPTPDLRKLPRGRDPMVVCTTAMTDATRRALTDALTTPGGFYIRPIAGIALQIYSPAKRLAVVVREIDQRQP